MQSVRGGAAPRHVIRLKGEKRKSLLILSVYHHLSVVQSTNIECFPMITWKITFKLERKKLDYLFIKKVGKSIKAQKSTFEIWRSVRLFRWLIITAKWWGGQTAAPSLRQIVRKTDVLWAVSPSSPGPVRWKVSLLQTVQLKSVAGGRGCQVRKTLQ